MGTRSAVMVKNVLAHLTYCCRYKQVIRNDEKKICLAMKFRKIFFKEALRKNENFFRTLCALNYAMRVEKSSF